MHRMHIAHALPNRNDAPPRSGVASAAIARRTTPLQCDSASPPRDRCIPRYSCARCKRWRGMRCAPIG
ncbi:hypothetical protein [Lysobacter gummosus]|uniref:hypothetical protein n=1 Tax=Lysobacter gummosus TaxID=262324 RepID=UPI003642C95C